MKKAVNRPAIAIGGLLYFLGGLYIFFAKNSGTFEMKELVLGTVIMTFGLFQILHGLFRPGSPMIKMEYIPLALGLITCFIIAELYLMPSLIFGLEVYVGSGLPFAGLTIGILFFKSNVQRSPLVLGLILNTVLLGFILIVWFQACRHS